MALPNTLKGWINAFDNHRGASANFDEFNKAVVEYSVIELISQTLFEKSNQWGKEVGLVKDEAPVKKEEPLTGMEIKIKEYFQDHAFRDPEIAKSIADLITLLTDVPAGRFIVNSKKRATGGFWQWTVVIPKPPNINSHSYTMGQPVLNAGGIDIFVKANGSTGDHLNSEPKCLELASLEQIKELVTRLIYSSRKMTEQLLVYVAEVPYE